MTMKTKFTPGPWVWDGNVCDYDKEQEAPWLVNESLSIEEGYVILGGEITCDNEANAALIKESPAMYEALSECYQQALEELRMSDEDVDINGDFYLCKAKRALYAARGESNED